MPRVKPISRKNASVLFSNEELNHLFDDDFDELNFDDDYDLDYRYNEPEDFKEYSFDYSERKKKGRKKRKSGKQEMEFKELEF